MFIRHMKFAKWSHSDPSHVCCVFTRATAFCESWEESGCAHLLVKLHHSTMTKEEEIPDWVGAKEFYDKYEPKEILGR